MKIPPTVALCYSLTSVSAPEMNLAVSFLNKHKQEEFWTKKVQKLFYIYIYKEGFL